MPRTVPEPTTAILDAIPLDFWENNTINHIAKTYNLTATQVIWYAKKHAITINKGMLDGRQKVREILDKVDTHTWQTSTFGEIAKTYGLTYDQVRVYCKVRKIVPAKNGDGKYRTILAELTAETLATTPLDKIAKAHGVSYDVLSKKLTDWGIAFVSPDSEVLSTKQKFKCITKEEWHSHTAEELAEKYALPVTSIRSYAIRNNINARSQDLKTLDAISLTEWKDLTIAEVVNRTGINHSKVRNYANNNKIAFKRVYKKTGNAAKACVD